MFAVREAAVQCLRSAAIGIRIGRVLTVRRAARVELPSTEQELAQGEGRRRRALPSGVVGGGAIKLRGWCVVEGGGSI